ncbi:MAG: hypothetical protein K6A35_05735 [bacterium]|nr:hypothetical protein [bacterium]
MEPFELSISPVFNEVIRTAENVYSAPQDSAAKEDLAQALHDMAEFSQFLASSFAEAIKVRPKTQLSQQVPGEFAAQLKIVTDVLNRLKNCLTSGEVATFPEQIALGRQALTQMFDIFERMKKEEESFPVFSKSPYIQELVRIATGVAKGQYKPDVLKSRVEWLYDRYREFKEDFASVREIPKENDDVEKLLPIAEQALQKMGIALDKMKRFQRGYDKKLLKEGCSDLLNASEVLMAVQEKLIKASTAQPAACPNCGALNPGGAKKCRSCGAQMPTIVGLSTQTMEFKENAPTEQKPTFTYLSRLEGSISSYKRQLISEADLKREIEFFAGKVKDGHEQFVKMKQEAVNNPEAQTPQGQALYSAMEEGISTLLEGISQLRSFFNTEDEQILDDGYELIQAGAAKLVDAQSAPGQS